MKRRINNTHVADHPEEQEGAEDEVEDAEGEEPEEHEILQAMDEDEEDEDECSEGEMDEEDLKEVFAAGWKAKQRTSEVRKNRGWKPSGGPAKTPAGQSRRLYSLSSGSFFSGQIVMMPRRR